MMTSRENDLWFSSQKNLGRGQILGHFPMMQPTLCELALKIVTYKIQVWELGEKRRARKLHITTPHVVNLKNIDVKHKTSPYNFQLNMKGLCNIHIRQLELSRN